MNLSDKELKKKVLIIDDALLIREVVKEIIDKESIEFYEAEDGKEGLEIFKKKRPDLVILDILMPKMNGVEVFKELKKIDPNSKVIIITALEESELKFTDQKPQGYIFKPFNISNVRTTVKKYI